MGATWSALSNRLEYMLYDPKAEEYAKRKAEREVQKAADDKRRAEIAQSQLTEQQKKEATDALNAKEKAQRESLATRSQFNIAQLIGQSSDGIYFHVKALLLLCFMIYGGHIAVNQAIGYNVPFRILSFVYGMLCSIYIVPKAMYDVYWKRTTLPYYAFFPLSTYEPKGDLEKYLVGPFCYRENPEAIEAREAVKKLYESGFVKVAMAASKVASTLSPAAAKSKSPVPSAAVNASAPASPASVNTPAPTPASLNTPASAPASVNTPASASVNTPASASVNTPAPASVNTPASASVNTPAPAPAPASVNTPAPAPAPASVNTPAPAPAPASVNTPAPAPKNP